MPPPTLTRTEARRVLGLGPHDGPEEAKQAFRRLARTHHPDVGGGADEFHRLQLALQRLQAPDAAEAVEAFRATPSRTPDARDRDLEIDHGPVPLDDLRFDAPLADRLDRDGLATVLAAPGGGLCGALRATSRAPGSRLNTVAGRLAGDFTSHLTIGDQRDDLGRAVVELRVTSGVRRARRALDGARLTDGWLRRRTTSGTVLRVALLPSQTRQQTAARVTRRLEGLLEQLAWPLPEWTPLPDER